MILTIKKFYKLFLIINLWISESFFYSVCYFYKILQIKFFNLLNFLKKDFDPIEKKINLEVSTVKKIEKEKFIDKTYLKHYYLKEIPEFLKEIVNSNRKEIVNYLGKNFVYETPSYYETFALPEPIKHLDIYANVWHVDSDTYKVLKVFVLTCDVNVNDGPLTYLDKTATEKNWNKFSVRGNENAIKSINEEKKFTGNIGSYLIIDTSRNLHRATSPLNMRSIISLSLYPSFAPKADKPRYDWKF